MNSDQPRYDVFIVELDGNKADTLIGDNMVLETGSHFTARQRKQTGLERINDAYTVVIVPTGKYKEGDVIAREDEVE